MEMPLETGRRYSLSKGVNATKLFAELIAAYNNSGERITLSVQLVGATERLVTFVTFDPHRMRQGLIAFTGQIANGPETVRVEGELGGMGGWLMVLPPR